MKRKTNVYLNIGLLLLAGVTAISCSLSAKPEPPLSAPDVLDFTDPMIGTGFHGHTFPGPVVPHGRIQLSPDTHLLGWEASSGYHYADSTLYGFSHTHLSGTGIGDLGDVLLLPFTSAVRSPQTKPEGRFSHSTEKSTPGYYQVSVAPWNVKAELTTSAYTGFHRYTYPEGQDARVMIDLSHILQPNWGHKLLESELTVTDPYTIKGYRKTSGWAAEDPIWFTCVFDKPILEYALHQDGQELSEVARAEGNSVILYAGFGKLDKPLNIKVSVSATDQEGADLNLAPDLTALNFDQAHARSQALWKEELDKIRIRTSDNAVLTNFYTALYHTRIAPMVYNDRDGRYRGMDGVIHQSATKNRYTAYSLWDTFRSWYPLMTIIDPAFSREMIYDLYAHSREGGLLPKWPLNGNYTGTMVGYPAVVLMADAFQKNLLDSIPEQLLEAAVTSSTWQPEFHKKHKGTRAEMVMPEHIYFKEKYGFVPLDSVKESVSYGLEMAYYDWCISRMADRLGRTELAAQYTKKGKAYEHYFDKDKKFMRGRNTDGSWNDTFNPNYSSHLEGEFVEGNSWQWTPFLPHAVEEFAGLLGGKEALGNWLDELFTTSATVEGENASADITGLIGQYAHGNEPSHHVPYMYQFSDRPWRTQEVLDTIMRNFYLPTPEGIIGNEDCGQMSAWYVLNALGIYQMTPGDGRYYFGRPMVDQASISCKDGWFFIDVRNNSPENKYLESVMLNGKTLDRNYILYEEIKAGNRLTFIMKSKP